MPKRLSPIPAQGATVDASGMLTLPFSRWFRDLGQNALEASRVVREDSGLSWASSGAVVFLTYQGPGGVSLQLPAAPLVPGILSGLMDGAPVTISTGTARAVALPAGNSGHLSGWFFADLRDGGV